MLIAPTVCGEPAFAVKFTSAAFADRAIAVNVRVVFGQCEGSFWQIAWPEEFKLATLKGINVDPQQAVIFCHRMGRCTDIHRQGV
jgi:hypothetical protein